MAPAYVPVPGLDAGSRKFKQVALASDSCANLVPDAYLASVALDHACPVASFDREFRRFDGLEIIVLSA